MYHNGLRKKEVVSVIHIMNVLRYNAADRIIDSSTYNRCGKMRGVGYLVYRVRQGIR